ncbi:hypothetical protein AUJ66_02460 [Candidatus Desantisbacteria bacterium CG1_02_38_46]|uniref:Nucleotidyltransferase-like domain-containing protein n=3 Tax=unclassified Candidatus Desantisiibacteriota TaxID=3106372 RepID=A0A2H9PBR8_9BACT|nr:MAG: hypothetical protein AUJ66_02460 [Candidatus Desantisbacteria bacterium CG1_02_38_46]PIU51119.1 MAG: hypothetical protein COS91_06190 [Candidatus Desantisbacteria bacterium CG07_land_8_20_14_0_80_39_15]PIZ16389.1 MAG: hypothetical protein COY51_02880 [Candidatus Desantisbacteria bacterium CG_4_10_14_0_8_um_filter_39_17]
MLEPVKKVLKIIDDNNLWKEGIILIGSWCFFLYQKYFGVRKYPFKTQDIDLLIKTPYRGKKKVSLVDIFEPLGFHHSFKADGSIYLWNPELKIEFLVPERGRGTDKAISIRELSIRAIPLRFLDIILDEPITVEDEGVAISIPNPAAFCLHKLLISQRRMKKDKKIKDMEQALYVSEVLKLEEIDKLYSTFPKKWKIRIKKSLEDAKLLFPLLNDLIDKLSFILQNLDNTKT